MQYETLCCSVATNNRVRDNERGDVRVRPSYTDNPFTHALALHNATIEVVMRNFRQKMSKKKLTKD